MVVKHQVKTPLRDMGFVPISKAHKMYDCAQHADFCTLLLLSFALRRSGKVNEKLVRAVW